MSQARPDLITDTDKVLEILLTNIDTVLKSINVSINAVYLIGSRLKESHIDKVDIHRSKKPTLHGDVDIFLESVDVLPRLHLIDIVMYLNSYFRLHHKIYVCFTIRKELPQNKQLLKEYN